jgi:hypothetical protein
MPSAASRAAISLRKRSGVSATQPRIVSACASSASERRSPPIGSASARPSFRQIAAHRTAVERAMRILRPAALADIPSSRAATNRCRKSDEYGFPIHADLLPGSQHESEIQHHGNPQRFNLIGPDSSRNAMASTSGISSLRKPRSRSPSTRLSRSRTGCTGISAAIVGAGNLASTSLGRTMCLLSTGPRTVKNSSARKPSTACRA